MYLAPPANAMVCLDEKTQIQALGRTQPWRPARQTHDYRRNGITGLFAASSTFDHWNEHPVPFVRTKTADRSTAIGGPRLTRLP